MPSSPGCWSGSMRGWCCWLPRCCRSHHRCLWPPRRWRRRRCSARCGGACSGWWTGGSTGPGMTPTGQWRRSRPGCRTPWTWTRYARISRPSFTGPLSRPTSRCGSARPGDDGSLPALARAHTRGSGQRLGETPGFRAVADQEHGGVVIEGMTDMPGNIAAQPVQNVVGIQIVVPGEGQREEGACLVPGLAHAVGVEQHLVARPERDSRLVAVLISQVRQAEGQVAVGRLNELSRAAAGQERCGMPAVQQIDLRAILAVLGEDGGDELLIGELASQADLDAVGDGRQVECIVSHLAEGAEDSRGGLWPPPGPFPGLA